MNPNFLHLDCETQADRTLACFSPCPRKRFSGCCPRPQCPQCLLACPLLLDSPLLTVAGCSFSFTSSKRTSRTTVWSRLPTPPHPRTHYLSLVMCLEPWSEFVSSLPFCLRASPSLSHSLLYSQCTVGTPHVFAEWIRIFPILMTDKVTSLYGCWWEW